MRILVDRFIYQGLRYVRTPPVTYTSATYWARTWDTDPYATAAVARSIYSRLPKSGTPRWLGSETSVRKTQLRSRLRRAGRIDA